MFQYMGLITSTDKNFKVSDWLKYDVNFPLRATTVPSLQWKCGDRHLWSPSFTGPDVSPGFAVMHQGRYILLPGAILAVPPWPRGLHHQPSRKAKLQKREIAENPAIGERVLYTKPTESCTYMQYCSIADCGGLPSHCTYPANAPIGTLFSSTVLPLSVLSSSPPR